MAETCDQTADAKAAELVRILDQHLAELKAGQAPSRAELVARHPELASQLEACLAGLEFIHGAETAPGRTQRLGDFRILREVGRGGMGAVFEAEQISLGRRVALKILRFGGISDPEAVGRFKREAETIAKLHHTNIVPIFAVGSERGVNYYAMQFIDGKSLAEVLAEHKQPLSPKRVAEWGLQTAEALTHAHQRGVIHRDVKPSNLLLDPDNRLWLTDFGLARRMDDVTLSLTGALLGTPRYMSPEQAAASTKRVDHRSDLFSLGATLYELLTGQPAFAGDTPHDVIRQILTCEPTPIRQLHSSVPRDLETIVMKCLAKEPGQRYSAASDLTSDLRAFLDGRPIRARRASLVERAVRWLKGQQRSVKLMATAAALTLVVTLLGIASWSGYGAWRQGSIKLSTPTPPLVAEFMGAQGNILRRETLPMQETASLPAGNYHVRASSEGSLSQTFDVEIQRASGLSYAVDLRDERLTSLDVARSFVYSDLGQETLSIVELGNDGIAPFGWRPAKAGKDSPALKDWPGFRWPWSDGSETHSGFGVHDLRPWIAPRTTDLNGDGRNDLICAGRHQAWLMAISGQDGSILWFAGLGQELKTPPQPNRPYYLRDSVASAVLGEPVIDYDCDGDGISDVIATLADIGPEPSRISGAQIAARCWIEAISGKTGQSLWKYELPAKWFELPSEVEVPYQCRWFAGSGTGSMSRGRTTMRTSRHATREPSQLERSGTHAYRPEPARRIAWGGKSPLAVVAGSHVVLLEADSGQEAAPAMKLGARLGRPTQWGDVDGDGSWELVILGERPARSSFDAPLARLTVWSVAQNKALWSKDVDAYWPLTQTWTLDPPQWPLVADLNGDARCEILTPDGCSSSGSRLGSDMGTPWGRVAALSGSSGEELWSRRIVSMDRQTNHLAAGPDIDCDGWREVYVATLSGADYHIYVDCLSGQSGQTLWTSAGGPPMGADSPHLAPPRWWNAGQDGWPQLIVEEVDDSHGRRQSLVCTFSAGTGRLTRVGHGITSVEPKDIDRDGIEDLVVFDAPSDRLDFGGKFHVIRGVAAEPWRRIGSIGQPAADFDGDQVTDLVHSFADGAVQAQCGRTGKPLWRGKPTTGIGAVGLRAAEHDLDGDGTEDLLAWASTSGPRRKSYPFYALSGRTGKVLWNARQIDAEFVNGVLAATAGDLDRDGKPEVIWMVASDHEYPVKRTSWSSHDVQLWLFVVSGQTGALKWKQPLSRPYGHAPGDTLQLQFQGIWLALAVGDADGDGTADLLVPAIASDEKKPPSLETRVLSGRDGKRLWSRPVVLDPNHQASLEQWVPPVVCDLSGDGRSEVVIVELATMQLSTGIGPAGYQVVALHGQDGSQRWNWYSKVLPGYVNAPPGKTKGELLRPVVLRTGPKAERVGVFLPGSEGKAAVLDDRGTPSERLVGHRPYSSGMWACDVDGDGIDEVAFLDESVLVIAPADNLEAPLWTRDTKSAGYVNVLGIVPRLAKHDVVTIQGNSPVIALVEDSTDNTVLGLDAANGNMVWTCPGPIPRTDDGAFLVANQLALLGARPNEPPYVYYAYASVARCRQAAFAEMTRTERGATAATVSLAAPGTTAAPAVLHAPGRDPRWLRPLPWVNEHFSWRQAVTFVGWGMFFSTMLVVIPGGYVIRLAWLRRFGLRTLLALPIVTSLFLTAALVRAPLDNDFATLLARMSIGLALAPAVVGIGLLVWWPLHGQWRRAAFWLAITVVASVACAAVALFQTGSWQPLMPEESYDWNGWYLIWFAGAYLTAWAAVVLLPLKFMVASAWKWWRSPASVAEGARPVTLHAAPTEPVVRKPAP